MNEFCWCGLKLIDNFGIKRCKKHGLQIEKVNFGKKDKIGKYSGKSKSPNAFNDYD